jgi:hypothetical protein
MTIKAAIDQQPDAWRPFTKPPRGTRDPLLNLDARAQAFLDRIAPLSADLAARGRTRALALKKLRRICQAEVRRLKAKHTPATIKLKSGSLLLDGFEYSLFGPGFPMRQCIQWLRLNQPRPLRLQPYEHAARILKSSGYESASTQILISKADDLCRHGELSWSARLISRSLGLVIGHGYRPHRALIFMLYIIFFGAAVFHDGKRNGLVTKTNASFSSVVMESNYPKFQPFIYSLDTFLPVVDLGQKSYWTPNANSGFQAKFSLIDFKFTWGSALRVYLWLHILLGWFFTTLWVAGFTGLVRKLN